MAVLVLLLPSLSGRAADLPSMLEYRVGDQAEADIATPIPLVVFDPARTQTLRSNEAARVAPIFRQNAMAGALAEAELRAAYTNAHAQFSAGLERLFNHPLPLLDAEFGSAQYREFLKAWREQNVSFPLTTQLAELWAFGDFGDIALERQLARLRRFTNTLVRADALPAEERLAAGSIRLMTVADLQTPLSLAQVDRSGRNVARTNVLTLGRLRQDAQKATNASERAEARYVAEFLRPNCFMDEALTREARTRRVEALNAADRYEAGQVIVRQGELITEKTKLALDELQSRTAAQRVQAAADQDRSRVEAEVEHAQRVATETLKTNRWLLAGMGAAAAGFVGLAIYVFLRRRALMEARHRAVPAGQALMLHDGATDAWRERALVAEARAEKASAMLRTKMLPHLARGVVQEFAQRLLSQRREILTEHQTAEQEVAELADRLQQVHAPLEERLRAYEKRIAELEAELAEKGEQNLALIRARIDSTRQKLDSERADTLNLG